MIHSGQYIDIGTGTSSDVLASKAEKCVKVSLDTSKLKRLSSIQDAYNIPQEETIIAFCKGTGLLFGITMDGIIFTDKAFYPYPRDDLKLQSNRILYTDLCRFIITRQFGDEDGAFLANRGGVFLQDENGEHQIYRATIIGKNQAAVEISQILDSVQTELCMKNSVAKNTMDATASRVFEEYKHKMKSGTTAKNDDNALNGLAQKSEYQDKAMLLMAEKIYRRCNHSAYENFLEKVKENVSDDLYQKLKTSASIFSSNLIADLSNIKLDISRDYLELANKNMRNYSEEERNKATSVMHALLLIRLLKFNSAKVQIAKIKKRFGSEVALPAEDVMLVYGNTKMKKVFDDILQGNDIDEACLEIADGLGLTPLHYAIIFADDDYVVDLLSRADWSKGNWNSNNKEIQNAYKYSVLASMKQRHKIFYQILCQTDPELKELTDSLETLRSQRDEAYHSYKIVNSSLSEARRALNQLHNNHASFSEINQVQDSIEELKNSQYKISRTISEIEEKIKGLDDLIPLKYRDKQTDTLKALRALSNSSHPLIRLLLEIYENCDEQNNLKYILADSNHQMRIYQSENHSVLLPENIPLNLPFRKVYIAEDGTIQREITEENTHTSNKSAPLRIYGDSWFSKEAHTNASILTAEYRKLAKQYHPDVCKEEFATEIFADIAQEYNSLMENMK